MVANIFSFSVLTGVLLLASGLARNHRLGNSVSLGTLGLIGVGLGLLKMTFTELPILLFQDQLDAYKVLDALLNPGVMVGPALVVVTALFIRGKDLYCAERDLLVAQKAAAVDSSVSSESFSNEILNEIASKALTKIAALRQRLKVESDKKSLSLQATEIRSLVELTIRPLSHKVWKSQSTSYSDYNTKELTRIWITSGTRKPMLYVLVISPGITSWLIMNAPGELVFVSLGLILSTVFLVQWLSSLFGKLSWRLAVARFVVTELVAVSVVWLVFAWHVLGAEEEIVASLISLMVFLPTFSWLIGIFSAGSAIRGAVRTELEQIIGEGSMSSLIERATLRIQTRQLAQTLHSQVQNELIATALRLEKGHLSEIEDLDQQLEEVERSLQETVARNQPHGNKTVLEELSEIIEAWDGFIAVEVEQSGDMNSLINNRLALIQVFNEAISNALRHGEADHVRILLTAKDAIEITVTDNGKRSASFRPGLGFALYSEITKGDFDFSSDSAGSKLVLRIPKKL